jgi:hypothetical protein
MSLNEAIELNVSTSSNTADFATKPDRFPHTSFPQSSITMKKIIQTKTITTQTNGFAPVTHQESHSIEIVDINETTTGHPSHPRPVFSHRRGAMASNLSEAIPKLDDDTFWTDTWQP